MNVKRGLRMCAMLSVLPVSRLSTQRISKPRRRKESQRWEPMNPAPPVIRTRRGRRDPDRRERRKRDFFMIPRAPSTHGARTISSGRARTFRDPDPSRHNGRNMPSFPGGCYNARPSGDALTDDRKGAHLSDRFTLWLGPILASGLIRTMRRLLRLTRVGENVVLDLHQAGRPYVHAFYHDQLLMMTYSYLGQRHGRRLVVLSSRHRDGEYVSRTLERFGHQMVRGSTGRGGVGGLKEMIRHLRGGRDVAFATDGPRGPRHRVQMGAIEAARMGRAPLVPVAFAASKKKRCDPGTPSRSRYHSRVLSSSTVSRSRSRSMLTARVWRRSA